MRVRFSRESQDSINKFHTFLFIVERPLHIQFRYENAIVLAMVMARVRTRSAEAAGAAAAEHSSHTFASIYLFTIFCDMQVNDSIRVLCRTYSQRLAILSKAR